MITHPRPLIDVFAAIPDFRKSRGKRHPLTAIFALACCAMLCGYRSYSAMAEWGRNYGVRLAQALGFTHDTPCAATLHTIFRRGKRDEFEAHLGAWADSVVGSLPAAPETPAVAMALDGKTLRGSKKQGAPGTHLLSALAHHIGVTLAQHAVDGKTNEITAVETLLGQLVLEGRIVTMDALLTPRHVAQTIVDKGGDYVMIVKDTQPQLRADIELVFALPPAGDRQETARTVDSGHGRIEQRNITTSEALVGYSAWPGLAQVCELGRHVITQNTIEERVEVVYGVTRLSPARGRSASGRGTHTHLALVWLRSPTGPAIPGGILVSMALHLHCASALCCTKLAMASASISRRWMMTSWYNSRAGHADDPAGL